MSTQTRVQQQSGTSAAAATTVSATLSPAATAGNIIWCAVGIDKSSGTITPPSGFTTVVSQDSASVSTWIGWKVAAGGETAISLSHVTASTAGDTMYLSEWSDSNSGGTWTICGSASDQTNNSTRTVTPSGTTAATSDAGQAAAFFTIDSGQSNSGTPTYTNSYTNVHNYASTGRGDVAVAELAAVTAGTTATTSQTHSPTADQTTGCIVVFAKVTSGLSGTASLTATATSSSSGQAQGTAALTETATPSSTGQAQGGASLTATATSTSTGRAQGAASLTATATPSSSGQAQGGATLTATATTSASGILGTTFTGTASQTATASPSSSGRAQGGAALTITATSTSSGQARGGATTLTVTASTSAAGRIVAAARDLDILDTIRGPRFTDLITEAPV